MTIFSTIPQALEELKYGRPLIVVDKPNRENQGDLIFPAETVSIEKVNFMIQKCHGFICTPITKTRCLQLNLPLMVAPQHNRERTRLNFTVSVDSENVQDFGVSAADRTKTIQMIADPQAYAGNLLRPGHIFPILAADGGILEREGHTEATIELISMAGFSPCGVLCEILRADGSVARLLDLKRFADAYNIKIVSIADLVAYRQQYPRTLGSTKTLLKTASSQLQTAYGKFQLTIYTSILDRQEHIALTLGKKMYRSTLVRIHSSCFTGDTLLSLKCDCRQQLHLSMKMIARQGKGIILYLNQEGRGIGLANKIRAYNLQDSGLDTVEANTMLGFHPDIREYNVAAEILKDIGAHRVILLTNNPSKVYGLEKNGINVVEQRSIEISPNRMNKAYLIAKKNKLEHSLSLV